MVERPEPPGVNWVEEAEDPDLERRLGEELERRRLGRREERERRRYDSRARRLYILFVLIVLGLVGLIGYGVWEVATTQFG